MALEEKLYQEAREHIDDIAARFATGKCVSCGTAGAKQLISARFLWRKQVSVSPREFVRVEHETMHPLCSGCFGHLRQRRRIWWIVRMIYGISLGSALSGVAGAGAVLYFMHMSATEHAEAMFFLIGSLVLVPIAGFLSFYHRALSVPGPLVDLTRGSWECWEVSELNADTKPLSTEIQVQRTVLPSL